MTGYEKENNNFIIEHGVLKQYTGSDAVVHIPAGIHTVGYAAFRGNAALQQVVVPDGVVKIDSLAFAGCSNLQQVHLPVGVAEIGYSAFEHCTALQQINLPDGLLLLDRMAFLGCTALADISFPDTLSTVGRDAFRDTAWLTNQQEGVIYAGRLALFTKGNVTEAHIRPGTVKICVDAFRNCTSLTAVTLPQSLVTLEDRAFQNCRKLREITIPKYVAHIGYRAFDECVKLHVLMEAERPNIGRQCFMDNATVRITAMDPAKLPDNIRQSAILAFADDVCNNTALDNRFYKRFMKYIYSRRKLLYPLALEHWNLLQLMMQEHVIPLEDVDDILDSVLAGEQAEAVAALIQYKQTISQSVDGDLDDFGNPDGLDDFMAGWDDLELSWDLPAQEKTSEELQKEWGTKKCSDGTYTLLMYHGTDLEMTVPSKIGDKMITAISPSACSPQRHGIKRETAEHRRSIRTVTVQEGITKIGNHAFADCDNLTQVTLPHSIIEIGYEAFRNCVSLTEITLPQSVEKIGRAAFAGCTNLTMIHVPADVHIADDAFAGCGGVPMAAKEERREML